MFHKIYVFAIFAGVVCASYASDDIQQIATSEVFVESGRNVQEYVAQENVYTGEGAKFDENEYGEVIPVWPLEGSDVDVTVACGESGCAPNKIVTKVGSGLVIENNITTHGAGWSGGPSIINNRPIPVGFDYECANGAEMPLMRREMLEDDGGSVLAMSYNGRKNCNKGGDSYAMFAERAGFVMETENVPEVASGKSVEIKVDETGLAEENVTAQKKDQVRSWIVADGQTLREVLQSWCDKEGWDLVWATAREYPIEASAIFKGRFVDVASALVRNFERATPVPYAKFYKGNRVIVISTSEE